MPAATHIEKEGCFTNTERLVQWRDKALDPPGDCRSELWFMHHLFKRVRAHYADSTDKRDWPIQNLTWDYSEHGPNAEPSADEVLREINGYDLTTGELVSGFADLADDGSTACGCWIYSGIYADGVNQARRREPGDLVEARRLGGARVGLGVARQPPRALLARQRRPRGAPVVRAQALRLVGRREVDRLRRAGLPGRQAARTTSPRTTPRAWTRSPAPTRSSCRPTAAAGCSRPAGCSTARCRRTTSRSSRR